MQPSSDTTSAIARRAKREATKLRGLTWRSVLAVTRRHAALSAVLACFVIATFIVPTLAPIATTDDWGYARSSEILYHDHRLEVFPVVAATAIFQIAWGTLFAWLLEPSLGTFRVSTLVMVTLGAWALYGLLRQLQIDRQRSALGVAAYLFNPLTFILAYTFMTDPHFTSLLLIATAFYARGLVDDRRGDLATIAGSTVAACAFLVRQQGALIPLAVFLFLVLVRRLRLDWPSLLLGLRVCAVPVLTTIGYYLWLRQVNDVPAVQASFLRDAVEDGWTGLATLTRRLIVIEIAYLGLFVMPVALAAIPAARRLLRGLRPRGWLIVAAWEATIVAGVAAAWAVGTRMPYIAQFVGSGGLGPPDVLGSRPVLIGPVFRSWLTLACVFASLILIVCLCRRLDLPRAPASAGAGLVLSIAFWQIVGILPPSYHYANRGGSLDRYLLPLAPLALALLLWSLADVKLSIAGGWIVVAAFAVVSIIGTRDYLIYMSSVWRLAREATSAGVAIDRLDAGSGWDGYHLYEYSRDHRVKTRTPQPPWWISFYAPVTDSSYVVSGTPRKGYLVIRRQEYSSWLTPERTWLYLLRRPTAPWPPHGVAPGSRQGWWGAG